MYDPASKGLRHGGNPLRSAKNSQRHSTFIDLVNGLACGGDGGRLSGGDPGGGWGGSNPPRRVDSPALTDEVEEAAPQQRLPRRESLDLY